MIIRSLVISDAQLIRKVFSSTKTAGRPFIKLFDEAFGRKGMLIHHHVRMLKVFHQIRVGIYNNVLSFPHDAAGIVFADGPAAREQRTFMMRHLKDFGAHGQSMELRVLAEIDNLLSSLNSRAGQPQQVSRLYYSNVVNSLLSILFSKKFESDDPTIAEFGQILSR